MRTTITISDDLAAEVHALIEDRSFSDFARESIAIHVERIRREQLASAMKEGYAAEAAESSLDADWTGIETEGL